MRISQPASNHLRAIRSRFTTITRFVSFYGDDFQGRATTGARVRIEWVLNWRAWLRIARACNDLYESSAFSTASARRSRPSFSFRRSPHRVRCMRGIAVKIYTPRVISISSATTIRSSSNRTPSGFLLQFFAKAPLSCPATRNCTAPR